MRHVQQVPLMRPHAEDGAELGVGTRLLGVEYMRAHTSRYDTRPITAPSGQDSKDCVCVDSDLMVAKL